jgi:ribosomal-protein-alanine N-acetyltransferase
MGNRWTEQVPSLRGDVTTLREIAMSDVTTLYTLFSDPAVTAYMAPPPPTLAKFAGFVVWSHKEREAGRGLCFGVVPDPMTVAVGILQVRYTDATLSTAEWGFVLSSHFWSTGAFVDAATQVVEFAFTTLGVDRLQARITSRNRRAQAAVRRLGAWPESTLPDTSPVGVSRDPQVMWTLRDHDWRNLPRQPRFPADNVRQRIRNAVHRAQSELLLSETPDTVEPYPLFLFDRRRND